MTSRSCLHNHPLSVSTGMLNKIGNEQGLFRIRIEFQIPSRKSSPELGSDYGTKPSRSFHEETVHPRHPGNRAHPERIPQRVCQRIHQHASPCLVRNADPNPGLLRRRSRRTSRIGRPGLCSGLSQHDSQCGIDSVRGLLRRRSRWTSRIGRPGLCSGLSQHDSQCGIDSAGLLLRRRSRRASRIGRSGLCSGLSQHDSQCGIDSAGLLLRWRSRWASRIGRSGLCSGLGQHGSQSLVCDGDPPRCLLRWRSRWASGIGRTGPGSGRVDRNAALILVGRLSARRGGQ